MSQSTFPMPRPYSYDDKSQTKGISNYDGLTLCLNDNPVIL